MDPEAAEVKASGGVVWRRAPGGDVELVVVHRPRYDDWSLPKGKLDPGESWEDAALREVEEEVGLRCRLGPELESTSYRDTKARKKTVRYWAMELPEGRQPVEGDGVDELAWLTPNEADEKLSWGRDRAVLRSLPVEELG